VQHASRSKEGGRRKQVSGQDLVLLQRRLQAKVRSEPRAVRKPLTEAEAPECVGSFVAEAQSRVQQSVKLKPGYLMVWGGLFEHLDSGRGRLMVVVPFTFLLIFVLLFITFHSVGQAALVFTGIPFAITGGVISLLARDLTFSMSVGVGFIAVSGVAWR